MLIETTKGVMDDALLEKRDVKVGDEKDPTWIEYWLDGERVYRAVRTTHGYIDETRLRRIDGDISWFEYWLGNELVHRSADMVLKPVSANSDVARFTG